MQEKQELPKFPVFYLISRTIRIEKLLSEIMEFNEFRFLPQKQKQLKDEFMKITNMLDIFNFIELNLKGSSKDKLMSCLNKNTDLKVIIKLNKELVHGPRLMCDPLVSFAVECSFRNLIIL